MRNYKRILMGALVICLLSACSAIASAMPTVGIGLQANLLPEAKIDIAAPVTQRTDQLVYKPVANTNLIVVVSLDNERQVDLAIASAVLETNAKLANEEAILMARLINEVGWN